MINDSIEKKKNLTFYLGYIFKGGLVVSLGEIILKGLNILLIPIYTAYLTPKDFGIIALTTSIVSFLGLFYNPGIISAAQRKYYSSEDELDKKEIIGSTYLFVLLFPLIISLIAVIVGYFFSESIFKDYAFYPFGYIAILLAFFTQPKRIWVLLLSMKYKIQKSAIYNVIGGVVSLLLSLFLVINLKYGALGKILALIPSAIFIFYLANKTILQYIQKQWSFSKMKELLIFGLPLIVAVWSYEILFIADRFILEGMIGTEELGVYSIAYQLAQIPIFLAVGIRKVWNPIFYENMKNESYDIVKGLISGYVIFITLICLGIILFAKEFVILMTDSRYYSAIPVIGIITGGIFFNSLITITNSFLGFQNKFKNTSKIALVSAILNIVLNFILIPKLGISGAALATLFSYLVYFVLGVYLVKDYLNKINLRKDLLLCFIIIVSAIIYTSFAGIEIIDIKEVVIKIILIVILLGILLKSILPQIKNIIKNKRKNKRKNE